MLSDWAAWEKMEEVDEKMALKAVGLEQAPHRIRSCERAGDTRDSYAGKFFCSQRIFTLKFGTSGAEMFPSLGEIVWGSS